MQHMYCTIVHVSITMWQQVEVASNDPVIMKVMHIHSKDAK